MRTMVDPYLPEALVDLIMGFSGPEDAVRLAFTCKSVASLFRAKHAGRCWKEVLLRQATALGAGPPEHTLFEEAGEVVKLSRNVGMPIPLRWSCSSERVSWDDFNDEVREYREFNGTLFDGVDDEYVLLDLLEVYQTEHPADSPPLLCAWKGRIWGASPPWFEEDVLLTGARAALRSEDAPPTGSNGSNVKDEAEEYAKSLVYGRRLYTLAT